LGWTHQWRHKNIGSIVKFEGNNMQIYMMYHMYRFVSEEKFI